MNFNSVIFPAPESCYEYRLVENILWIPKTQEKESDQTDVSTADEEQLKDSKKPSKGLFSGLVGKKPKKFGNHLNPSLTIAHSFYFNIVQNVIPCLYLPYKEGSDKILIYFHGNSEDIGWAHEFTCSLRDQLKVTPPSF